MREIPPAAAVGIFLAVFGGLVLLAIPFTTTFRGKITDLVCGLVIIGIGGALVAAKDRFK